ncbi:gamma carbonic anhydrase family protein [Geitlerinema sp. P-1104]|uniref:gamma carbonic anhydrase family protein n=1 Tax=Geitlerinema sp. P-1104 TaxID=2546230 RepID=UPI001477362B|nr:gamma carbonic anhydrase family protein [Geitlerinema sp. P-1104]NMG57037.1 gamma carbonic anhydrase family protein [Geitlerinema sp. P-1104]
MTSSPNFSPNDSRPTYWPPVDCSQASFVAGNATVLGDVILEAGASVWYGAVIRGDVVSIRVGASSNVQDGAILHGDPGEPLVLEELVTVGHRAVIHSAYVERGCLVGIGATLLNGVRVGTGSIIGAGALVTKDVPPRSLVLGVPGKVVRPVSEEQVLDLIDHARRYEQLARVHAGTGSDLGFQGPTPEP